MRRGLMLFLLVWAMFGVTMLTLGYTDTIYKLELSSGYLSRAQAAGFAEEVSLYLSLARPLIPDHGNPVWILPTSRTDFSLITSDLERVSRRVDILKGVTRDSSAYAQGMSDVRGRLSVIIGQIGEAMPYTLFTPVNIGLALLWLSAPYIVHRISDRKHHRRLEERRPVPASA